MLTIEQVAKQVADINGMAWLCDIAAVIGLPMTDVAEIAMARGMDWVRCDLPAAFPKASRSEVIVDLGFVKVSLHYIKV